MKITSSEDELRRALMKELADQINAKMLMQIGIIQKKISKFVSKEVYDCEECKALRYGILKYDFGLDFDPTKDIATAVAESVKVRHEKYRVRGKGFSGGLFLEIQPDDFMNVLSLPTASFVSENGYEVPWLEWLLTKGTSVILYDFGVNYISGGRTGFAIMQDSKAPFIVEPLYSGTIQDNFITRTLNNSKDELDSILWQSFQV